MKFDDVLRRARLNESTGQYVLKSGALPGTPEGARGRHRRFTPEQAFRFALAARLVMSGIPLSRAVAIVEYCFERRARFLGQWAARRPGLLFPARRTAPWKLLVYDDELVRLWRRGLAEHWAEEWFSVTENGTVDDGDYPDPIAVHDINLTLLELKLAGDPANGAGADATGDVQVVGPPARPAPPTTSTTTTTTTPTPTPTPTDVTRSTGGPARPRRRRSS